MASNNLEKTLEYLKLQHILRSENLRVLFKEYFYMIFSTLKDIIQAQNKINNSIS